MKREEAYREVTNRIKDQLRQGVVPWRKPWGEQVRNIPVSDMAMVVPKNAQTKKPYRGVNIILLWMAGFESEYWGTEKTWQDLGATVNDDALPVTIYFTSIINGRRGRVPFFKSYKVYNLAQVVGCDGLRSHFLGRVGGGGYEDLKAMVTATKAKIVDSPDSAWYDLATDTIHRPPRQLFRTDIGYHTTELHELVHWTGGTYRLKRVFGHKNTPEYAFEELIAELGTCFVAAAMDIPERMSEIPNHANYLAEWLGVLSNDNGAFMRACGAAEHAANYLLKIQRVYVEGILEHEEQAVQYDD